MLPSITTIRFHKVQTFAVSIFFVLLYEHASQTVLHQQEEGFYAHSLYVPFDEFNSCLDESFYTRNLITCSMTCKQVSCISGKLLISLDFVLLADKEVIYIPVNKINNKHVNAHILE